VTASIVEFPRTLMSLWLRNRAAGIRPIGEIITEARSGRLLGVKPLDSGFEFEDIDEVVALAAMRRHT
jgi:hypothetical protein